MPPPITLSTLVASLREEQAVAFNAAVHHLRNAAPGREGSLLLVSPTGTGKSYIQGAIHRTMREQYGTPIVSTFPQSEIAEAVYLKTYGVDAVLFRAVSPARRQAQLVAAGFWTIKRLYNELTAGRIPLPPMLQHDEAHHSADDTHEMVHGICGLCPRVGATATDYRGTIVETAKLRERWPQLHRVLTLKQAVQLRRMSQPTFDVWPLINDELIDVVAGEFRVSKVEGHIEKKLDDLVERLRPFVDDAPGNGVRWDRPTMIAVPGVRAVEMVVAAMNAAGLPAGGVTGTTSDADRATAFANVVARREALVQIRVVGEGVDLPIRRLIDLAPTVSPVLWMQRVGRIARTVGVGEAAPEYIACCHNLARHAYLWHGLLPAGTMKKATEVWGKDFKPSRRFLARAVDIEGLGRFQPAAIPFADGATGTMYVMQSKDGSEQYAVVLHPERPDPWFFGRRIPFTGRTLTKDVADGVTVEFRERDYDAPEAKWRGLKALPELRGMQTIKPGMLTDPQQAWWKRNAKVYALDPDAEITNREFQILPILANARPGRLEA